MHRCDSEWRGGTKVVCVLTGVWLLLLRLLVVSSAPQQATMRPHNYIGDGCADWPLDGGMRKAKGEQRRLQASHMLCPTSSGVV